MYAAVIGVLMITAACVMLVSSGLRGKKLLGAIAAYFAFCALVAWLMLGGSAMGLLVGAAPYGLFILAKLCISRDADRTSFVQHEHEEELR